MLKVTSLKPEYISDAQKINKIAYVKIVKYCTKKFRYPAEPYLFLRVIDSPPNKPPKKRKKTNENSF
jgi:hypothetical protein